MADTIRTKSAVQTLLADNVAAAISPQDHRDAFVSVCGALYQKAVSTTPYSVADDDIVLLVNASGGARTVNLPAASSSTHRTLFIKKTDTSANAVTIDGNASETIDGATTLTLNQAYAGVIIVCDGSNWFTLGDV